MKPGWKTSEFWLTLITQILGILQLAGVLKAEEAGPLSQGTGQIIGGLMTIGPPIGYAISRGIAKLKAPSAGMAALLTLLLLPAFLPAPTQAATLTFAWEQPDLVVGNANFEGWVIFHRQGSEGVFTQLGSIMVWDGTVKPEYSAPWTLTASAGQETTYQFLCRAKNKESAGGEWSGDSNVVTQVIDLKAPSMPVVATTIPAVLPVGASFTFGGTKEAGASIWVNGAEVIAANAETAWQVTVTVVKGENSFSITSKDAAPWLNESAATQVTFQGTEAPAIPVQLHVTVTAQ